MVRPQILGCASGLPRMNRQVVAGGASNPRAMSNAGRPTGLTALAWAVTGPGLVRLARLSFRSRSSRASNVRSPVANTVTTRGNRPRCSTAIHPMASRRRTIRDMPATSRLPKTSARTRLPGQQRPDRAAPSMRRKTVISLAVRPLPFATKLPLCRPGRTRSVCGGKEKSPKVMCRNNIERFALIQCVMYRVVSNLLHYNSCRVGRAS